MTISPDARTPSATVHDLSGSTPPGAGATMQPFGVATEAAAVAELPDTFMPLGAAAAGVVAGLASHRTAAVHPDAAVIDLAARVTALVARELRVVLRTCRIEGAVFEAMRAHPRAELSEPKLCFSSSRSTDTDGAQVMTIREPAGWAEEARALREARDTALAAREILEQAEEARRGLPRWMKLRERATSRLARWGMQLAAMEPATQAGLAAKATAFVAAAEGSELPDAWRQALAISLGRDAVRVLAAEVVAPDGREGPSDPFASYHAEIQGLQVIIATAEERSLEQEAAWKRWKEIDSLFLGSHPTTLAGAIGALQLARREHNQFKIEDHQGDEIGIDDRLIEHAFEGALNILQPMVERNVPTRCGVTSAASAPLSATVAA